MEAVGLEEDKDFKRYYMGARDMLDSLKDGTTDIVSVPIGLNSSLIIDLCNSADVRFLPVSKEIMNKFNTEFYKEVEPWVWHPIPAGSYRLQDDEVPTCAYMGIQATTKQMDADVVYEIVKLWWEYEDERNEMHAAIKDCTEEATKALLAHPPAPFHEGALRYYKERGWV